MPLVRFLPPTDTRIRNTVLAIADELTEDGLVLRYRVEETDDGLKGRGGDVRDLLVLARFRAGRDRRAPAGARALREDALVRVAAPAVRRGDRPAHRPPPGQLPAGVHAPGADQRGHARDPRRPLGGHAAVLSGRADGRSPSSAAAGVGGSSTCPTPGRPRRAAGRGHRARRLRDRRRDRRRRVRLGAAGPRSARARARVPGPRARGARRAAASRRRPRGRRGPPPRPGAVRRVRRGEFDMCRNGEYTERGIKEIHGYGSTIWTVEADYAVRLDPPRERRRADGADDDRGQGVGPHREGSPRRAYIDQEARARDGRRADRAAGRAARVSTSTRRSRARPGRVGARSPTWCAISARPTTRSVAEAVGECEPDVIIEATGVGQLVFDAMTATAARRGSSA